METNETRCSTVVDRVSDGSRLVFMGDRGETMYTVNKDDPVRLTGQHTPQVIPATQRKNRPYRKCRVCRKKGIRHDTRWYCPDCPSQPPLCNSDCFMNYHTKLVYWTS